jgi:hypothetical protein
LCYDLSEPLTTYRGLTKADALAYQLLNTAWYKVIRDSGVEKGRNSSIYRRYS